MKNYKLITFFILGSTLLFLNTAIAQLSDRVNNPTTFKTGTRPIKGNLGLLVGVNIDDMKSIFESGDSTFYQRLPIIYFKYYHKDNLVFRMGIYSYRKSSVIKGDLDPMLNGGIKYRDYTNNTFEILLNPGVERHFSISNMLDVYIGGALPLGCVRQIKNSTENFNTGNSINETSRLSYVVGISGFVGLRAFVADLPLAMGIEFGTQGRTYLSNKIKNEVTINNQKQVYYTVDGDKDATKYGFFKSLESRRSEAKTSVTLTLSYYFNQ